MIIGVMRRWLCLRCTVLDGLEFHLSKYANSKDRQHSGGVDLGAIENPLQGSGSNHQLPFTALISGSPRPPMSPILASFEEAIEQWGCSGK